MSKLIELPNGDWIAPEAVKAVRKLPAGFCEISNTILEPRFVVDAHGGGYTVIECTDAADVDAKVALLVEAINQS